MQTLWDMLRGQGSDKTIVEACSQLIEEEVSSKSGLSGMALKGGFKAFKSFQPGLLHDAIRKLLPEFAQSLDPLFQESREHQSSFGDYLAQHAVRGANALLSITDRRAMSLSSGVLKSTYQKLRPMAQKHVEAALPRVGKLVDRFAKESNTTMPRPVV